MISVVIPAFDSEATIARAIESVLAQTYKDYEIIVVDDGSKDGTGDAVRAFGDKVNYIYQENAGVSVARNTALAAAKGEWIAFLDADDQWLPDKLEKQMQLLERKKGLKWCSGIRYHCYGQQKFVVGNIKKITCDLNNTEYFHVDGFTKIDRFSYIGQGNLLGRGDDNGPSIGYGLRHR